jgi:hypothetical protein
MERKLKPGLGRLRLASSTPSGWTASTASFARPATSGPAAGPSVRATCGTSTRSCRAPYLRLAATTGLRREELCALRWVDLDLEAAEV